MPDIEVKDDGGPAFPVPANEQQQISEGWSDQPTGMTLRDWFAGQALVGILSGNVWKEYKISNDPVTEAYEVADAMIKAREQS